MIQIINKYHCARNVGPSYQTVFCCRSRQSGDEANKSKHQIKLLMILSFMMKYKTQYITISHTCGVNNCSYVGLYVISLADGSIRKRFVSVS